MIKVIYSDGCSLMAGAEHDSWRINDDTGFEECDTVWPVYIQKNLFAQSTMFSRATTGSSNYGIARRTIKFVNELLEKYDPDEILVCIMWTSLYRTEFRVDKETNENRPRNNDEVNFISILPTDNMIHLNQKPTGELADNNYRKKFLHSNKLLKVSDSLYQSMNRNLNFAYYSYSQIEYVNLFLKSHGIKSLQCFGFGCHLDYKNFVPTADVAHDNYTRQIAKRCEEYDIYYVRKKFAEGFYEWAGHSHKFGPGLHPLDGAHLQWSRQMMRKIG